MCVIVAHEPGKRLPTTTEMEQCFKWNNDGAGIAFINQREMVTIHKGFMTFKKFMEAYESHEFAEEHAFLLHFRIGTQGKKDAGNCHPFPLTKKINRLRATNLDVHVAMAHNGILWNNSKSKKLSDTQEYIIEILAEKLVRRNLRNPVIRELVRDHAGATNKLAFLFRNSDIMTLGLFNPIEGLRFSNDYWRPKTAYIGAGGKTGVAVKYDNCDYCGHSVNTNTLVFDNGYYCCTWCRSGPSQYTAQTCTICNLEYHKNFFGVDGVCKACTSMIEANTGVGGRGDADSFGVVREESSAEYLIVCDICKKEVDEIDTFTIDGKEVCETCLQLKEIGEDEDGTDSDAESSRLHNRRSSDNSNESEGGTTETNSDIREETSGEGTVLEGSSGGVSGVPEGTGDEEGSVEGSGEDDSTSSEDGKTCH